MTNQDKFLKLAFDADESVDLEAVLNAAHLAAAESGDIGPVGVVEVGTGYCSRLLAYRDKLLRQSGGSGALTMGDVQAQRERTEAQFAAHDRRQAAIAAAALATIAGVGVSLATGQPITGAMALGYAKKMLGAFRDGGGE